MRRREISANLPIPRAPEPANIDTTPMIRTMRAYHPSDLPALQSIRAAAFAPVFQSFRSIVGPDIASIAFNNADAEQAHHLHAICAPDSTYHVQVVTVGDQPVAFVSYTLDPTSRIGEIGLNAVHPTHAGQGLGTWMYEQVLTHMKTQNMQLATVGTGGDPSHAPARKAYENAGFGPAIPSVYLYRVL